MGLRLSAQSDDLRVGGPLTGPNVKDAKRVMPTHESQGEDPFGSSYVSTTDYRGNVTSVTTYADAPGASGTITHSTTYDIAGNVMTAQVDCCQLKSFTYSGAGSGASHDYAYPISVTSGNPSGLHLTTSATFDYDTGLPATATDENSQETDYSYNSDSLRLNSATYPKLKTGVRPPILRFLVCDSWG